MTIELEKVLPPELFEKLNAEAARQNTPVAELLRDALAADLEDDADDDEDMNEAEILEGFRQGWRDILDGNVIPLTRQWNITSQIRAERTGDGPTVDYSARFLKEIENLEAQYPDFTIRHRDRMYPVRHPARKTSFLPQTQPVILAVAVTRDSSLLLLLFTPRRRQGEARHVVPAFSNY